MISQDFLLIPGQTPPFWLKHVNMILETIVKAIPGMSASCYYMAYVKFLLGKCVEIEEHLNASPEVMINAAVITIPECLCRRSEESPAASEPVHGERADRARDPPSAGPTAPEGWRPRLVSELPGGWSQHQLPGERGASCSVKYIVFFLV